MACLLVSSPLSSGLSCEAGSFSHCGNCYSPQSALSLSFPLKSAPPSKPTEFGTQLCPHGLLHGHGFSELAHRASPWVLTGLVVLVDFFFNSLAVEVPCSFIFWHFWPFIYFRLVVSSFQLCEEAKGFYLCLHLGRNSTKVLKGGLIKLIMHQNLSLV